MDYWWTSIEKAYALISNPRSNWSCRLCFCHLHIYREINCRKSTGNGRRIRRLSVGNLFVINDGIPTDTLSVIDISSPRIFHRPSIGNIIGNLSQFNSQQEKTRCILAIENRSRILLPARLLMDHRLLLPSENACFLVVLSLFLSVERTRSRRVDDDKVYVLGSFALPRLTGNGTWFDHELLG